jgi:heme iron utilization protein
MATDTRAALAGLIRTHRQATLAVIEAGEPYTAMVSYVEDADLSGILIHLSNLSAHKRMLLANPQCSLLICEPDDGRAEVMSLARVAVQGRAALVDKAGPDYVAARTRFLQKLPSAALMFALADFDLLRIMPRRARYIAGFGRAFDVADWPAFFNAA